MSEKKDSGKIKTEYSIFNLATYIYVVLFLLVYPLMMNNKYFDITRTKYSCFVYLSIGYLVVAVISIVIDKTIGNRFICERISPLFWLILFTLSNIISFVVTDNKVLALTGKNGRFMGLGIYIIIAIVFFMLSIGGKFDETILYYFSPAVAIVFVLAIVQHMGIDILSLKSGINPKQYNIFVSTIGNINILASFVVICIGAFLCFSIFSERLESKIIGLAIITLSAMAAMISNSDSAYLGAFSVFVVVFIISYINDLLGEYLKNVIAFAAGTELIVLLNKYIIVNYDKRGGVARLLDNPKIATLLLLVSIVLYVLYSLVTKHYKDNMKKYTGRKEKNKEQNSKTNKKVVVFIFCILLLLGMESCYIIAKKKNMDIVQFNYKWGTYRGYIWSKCAETFTSAPIINKIFGFGQECIKNIVSNPNLEEMKFVTGKVYDNAHNELLQYLITIGIFGLISYIGLFVSGITYILKRAKNNCVAYAMAIACIGYFVQSLINLNQPITTPYFFVFMAIGIGCVSNKRRSI